MKNIDINILFKLPESFKQKGDESFWNYLQDNIKTIYDVNDLEIQIYDLFYHLTGDNLMESDIYVKKFGKGGRKIETITGKWWIDEGIPLLKQRYLDIMNNTK